MSAGCLNPNAVNYNAEASPDDYSCKYLIRHGEVCHYFTDVDPDTVIDKSFTLSYSVKGQTWVFFHDYIPDMYVHTREKLFSVKDSVVRKHNDNVPGYFDGTTKPFFIDIIFRADGDMLLEEVHWVTEYFSGITDNTFGTLSHITVWNSTQHTGRIPLSQVFRQLNYVNIRRTQGEWSFNDFRDALIVNPGTFLGTIFDNYAVDNSKIDTTPVWYKQQHMEDSWFCVRFEFDNAANVKVILHDTTIQALKSDR